MKNCKPIPPSQQVFLTLRETAKILRCSPATIKNRVKEGELTPRFRKGTKMLFSLAQIVGQ